jgi:hypothetical protein
MKNELQSNGNEHAVSLQVLIVYDNVSSGVRAKRPTRAISMPGPASRQHNTARIYESETPYAFASAPVPGGYAKRSIRSQP